MRYSRLVTSLGELTEIGCTLHTQEHESGNVVIMTQLMVGAQQDLVLAHAAYFTMSMWSTEIETTLERILAEVANS